MTSPTEGGPRRRALVVGTGLIGGSIALGLRRRGWHVSGLDADDERLREALAGGVIDAAGDDPDAEVVFVAVPAAGVAGVVAPAPGGARATPRRRRDRRRAGSRRRSWRRRTTRASSAGTPWPAPSRSGLHGADPDLFEGAVWVLTPTAVTDLQAFERLRGVVLSLGADVLVLSAADHDRLVAVVSHVPHLVAATLMNAASAGAEQDGALLRLAAGGFRDMTRVAAGHPGIWPDICAENALPIVEALDALVTDLQAMRDRVATRDRDGPPRLPPAGQRGPAQPARPRRAARAPRRAAHPACPTGPGVLAEITSLAADAGIGIYDIEIAHSAEGTRGVLILVVDGADADTLTAAVESHGLPGPGRAPVVTPPRVLVVTGGVPCRGTVRTPGEKSISHRAVLLGALAEGTSTVRGLSDGADVAASLAAVAAMGAGVERHERRDGRAPRGARAAPPSRPGPLDCGNSGTSMRLLAGLVAGFAWETELVGDESLSARPMDRVAEPLGLMGATVRGRGRALPPAAPRRGAAGCTASTGRPGGQRPGEVGHPARRAVGQRHHRRPRGGDDPHPHRGDARRGGGGHHGRALG